MVLNENAKKWVEALRSGRYRQTTGQLHNSVDGGYCCLGVACEVALENGLPLQTNEAHTYFDNEAHILPRSVQVWLGLENQTGRIGRFRFAPNIRFPKPVSRLGLQPAELSVLNDAQGYNFNDIADFIELNADHLFNQEN